MVAAYDLAAGWPSCSKLLHLVGGYSVYKIALTGYGQNISYSSREVAQSCPTLCDPVGCSLPSTSIHGILQARVLE